MRRGAMRVRTERQEAGPIPSETVVEIRTVTGSTEEVIVDSSQVDASGVEVGFIGQRGDEVLVELPRETLKGRWRLWVPKSTVAA
jgi:hypothetical protein